MIFWPFMFSVQILASAWKLSSVSDILKSSIQKSEFLKWSLLPLLSRLRLCTLYLKLSEISWEQASTTSTTVAGRQAGRQENRFAHTQKRSDVNVSTMQTAFDSVLLSFQLHTNFHKVRARSIMHENKTKQWDSLSFFSCKWHNKSALLLSHRVFFIIHFSVLHFIFNRVVFAESGTYSNPFKYTMDICALRLVPTSAWHKYATWNVYGDKSQTNSNPE